MLSLDVQNRYRDELRSRWPNWRPATEVYEAAIRRYPAPRYVRVLDAGCGRGGALEQLVGRRPPAVWPGPRFPLPGRTPVIAASHGRPC